MNKRSFFFIFLMTVTLFLTGCLTTSIDSASGKKSAHGYHSLLVCVDSDDMMLSNSLADYLDRNLEQYGLLVADDKIPDAILNVKITKIEAGKSISAQVKLQNFSSGSTVYSFNCTAEGKFKGQMCKQLAQDIVQKI